MSVTSTDVNPATASLPDGRVRATVVRASLGALAVAALLATPQLAHPAPVAAGSSCTGWTSISKPPPKIRVLRTHSGQVETVGFRRYVAIVMASGEWPSHFHQATLEAGAVATKQYAWYYTMRGHHRPFYRSSDGCYDVRDDTDDQLYRPESARPTARQWRAIDATWGLTLRKFGRFFLTGYRAGVTSGCAADANGWKLYSRSVQACARQGWSRQDIQEAYLGPNLSFVWSPDSGPIMAEPDVMLRARNTLPDAAATVTWRPTAKSAGITRYTLQRQVGRGAWKTVHVGSSRSRKTDAWLKIGTHNRFRVRATDAKGRTGPWTYSDARTATLRGPVGLRLGNTRTIAAKARSGWARARLTGRSIALVARTGPGMGKAKVFVNGKRVAVVDLARPTTTSREMVWARNFGSAKPRRVAVKAVGRDGVIEFRGFYVLR